MENNNVITSTNNELTTNLNKFDQYLEKYGLPTDNIIADSSERNNISNNLPQFLAKLHPEIKRDARYLSKFTAASAIGLFDAALNYIWNEVILNLRHKASIYGIDLFFDAAIGGKNRDLYKNEEDLGGIKDCVLLDTCKKLELISDIIYKKLTHILIMRNEIGSSHPNNATINAFELLGWLQTCVVDVINDRPSEAAIQIKSFIENIKTHTDVVDNPTIKSMGQAINELSTHNCNNLIVNLFGIYTSKESNNILRKNISLIAPSIWNNSSNNAKYKLGLILDGYRNNLHAEKEKYGKEFFDFCDGNSFRSLESRIIILDELAEDLIEAHNGWDNFYTEVPIIRNIMSYIKKEADIPKERNDRIIKIILKCRMGKGVSYKNGVSPVGKDIYDSFLNLLGDDNIAITLSLLYEFDINYLLSNSYCRDNMNDILNLFLKNAISDKLKEIIEMLIKRIPIIHKYIYDKKFKEISKSHLKTYDLD